MTEPNFPGRPDHPDFWVLSQVIIDQDSRSDNQTIPFGDRIAQVVDPDSLVYMAKQRALRILGPNASRGQLARLASVWLDAFMAGAAYQVEKTKQGGEGDDDVDGVGDV